MIETRKKGVLGDYEKKVSIDSKLGYKFSKVCVCVGVSARVRTRVRGGKGNEGEIMLS